MRVAGYFLLLAGWTIVLAAVALLAAPTPRGWFVATGVAMEIAGLVLAARSYVARHGDSR